MCTLFKRVLLAVGLAACLTPIVQAELQCPDNYPDMPCFVIQGNRLMVIDRSATPDYAGGDDQYYNDFLTAATQLNDTDGLLGAFASYMNSNNFALTHDNLILGYNRSGFYSILQDAHNGVPITQGNNYGYITPYLTFVIKPVPKTYYVVCQGCSPHQNPSHYCSGTAQCVWDCVGTGLGCAKD